MSNPINLGQLGSGPHSHSISDTLDVHDDLPADGVYYGAVSFAWSPDKNTIIAVDNDFGNVIGGAGGHVVYHNNGANGGGHGGNAYDVVDFPISQADIPELNVFGTAERWHAPDHILLRGFATPDGQALDSVQAWELEVAQHNIKINNHDTGQVDKIGQHIQETTATIHDALGVGAFAGVQAHDIKLVIDHTGDAGADGSHLPLLFAEPATHTA